MLKPGLILRNGCKRDFDLKPPLLGEIVFDLKGSELGYINKDGNIVWCNLGVDLVDDNDLTINKCSSVHIYTDSTNWSD